jgi:hypothetical protein
MDEFDHDYVTRLLFRLGRLKQDARPRWGKMTPRDLVRHLAQSLKYSMGRLGGAADRSNAVTRGIIKPLVLKRIVPIMKNLKCTLPADNQTENLDSLHVLLEEYLALVQAGELHPCAHPALGPLDVDEWARLHVLHFEHHLRQFGI